MCCEGKHRCQRGHHGHSTECSCGCHGSSSFGPNFWTKEEKINWLKEELVKSYEERIKALMNE